MPYPDHAQPLGADALLGAAQGETSSRAPERLASGRSPARRLLRGLIASLQHGHLVIQLPDGTRVERRAPLPGPEGVFVMHRWRAVRRLLLDGDVGFAEAYMDGDWSSPDVTSLIELAACNTTNSHFGQALRGAWPMRVLNRLRHWASSNTRRGSRRNIMFHYDLGNSFYESWLDRGMTYSSALYPDAGATADITLEQAQAAKQDRVIELLRPQPGQRVLEIGCGWGGLAQRLIEEGGCHVTGLTLSPAQRAYAISRLDQAGLATQADVRLQDYRDTTETFDRVVSIEMLEAVGREYWPTYFNRLRDRLVPGGIAVLQAISIAEDRYEDYVRGPDFIQKYIFPGGMLPTVAVIRQEVERAGLVLTSMEQFGLSYARTLAEWRSRFQLAWQNSAWTGSPGFAPSFRRMWEYYLCYCEGGFRAGSIDVGLYCVTRPA